MRLFVRLLRVPVMPNRKKAKPVVVSPVDVAAKRRDVRRQAVRAALKCRTADQLDRVVHRDEMLQRELDKIEEQQG